MTDRITIKITHPSLGDDQPVTEVTQKAFDGCWVHEGWEIDQRDGETKVRRPRSNPKAEEA